MKRADVDFEIGWVALSLSLNIGRKSLDKLLNHFDCDLSALLAAPRQEVLRVPGIGVVIADEIAAIDLDEVAAALRRWQQQGIVILTPRHPQYPGPLRELDNAPALLFARGCLHDWLWARTVAVVGTREPSSAGRNLARQLTMELARAGITVVSGLALGIDTVAHTNALDAGAATVAVLGSGVLNVYPPHNRGLASQIEQGGLLLCEAQPRQAVNAQRLVARNRIISGLSSLVVLVESQLGGGAMHALRFDKAQGRPIFTFDLPACGNQAALQNGAHKLCAADPLSALLGTASKNARQPMNQQAKMRLWHH